MTTQTANKEIRKALNTQEAATAKAIREYMKILGPETIGQRFAGWEADSAVADLANDVRALRGYQVR